MIVELETKKERLEHAHSESIAVMKEHIIIQVVETLTRKSLQVKTQVDELTNKF
jgi:hypothetical protein